jgi:hypothetical protein
MSIQYPKKDRGGASPIGREELHILRDPPKSYYTKKYEPVNIEDVMYMTRPDGGVGSDPTRINENIQYIRRGINPMVEVMYSNAGGGSTNSSLPNRQASNPYKVEVVRPPLYYVENRVPLSAPRIHQNYSITTNPRRDPQLVDNKVDQAPIKQATSVQKNAGNMRPTFGFAMETPKEFDVDYAINFNKNNFAVVSGATNTFGNTLLADIINSRLAEKNNYTVGSALSMPVKAEDNVRVINTDQVKDKETLLKNLTTNFSVFVYDPTNNTMQDVTANIKQKVHIAVEASKGMPILLNTNDGKFIKLKDYDWKVVNTNAGTTAIVLEIQNREFELDRNTPIFAINSNVSTEYNEPVKVNYNNINSIMENPMRIGGTSGKTNMTLYGYDEKLQRETQDQHKLTKQTNFGSYEDKVSKPAITGHSYQTGNLIRNDKSIQNRVSGLGDRFMSM